MKFFATYLFLIGIYVASPQVWASDLVIELRKSVATNQNKVTLADIAVIKQSSGSDLIAKQIGDEIIDDQVTMGVSKYYTQSYVARRLNAKFIRHNKPINIGGSRYTHVDYIGNLVAPNTYIDIGRQCLRSWLARHYQEFSILALGPTKELVVPSGDIKLSARRCDFFLRQKISVQVDVVVDQKLYQTIPVFFEIKAMDDVLTANTTLDALAPINPSALTLVRRDIAAINGTPIRHTNELQQKRLKNTVYKNGVLTQETLEPMPAVVKGARVIVNVSVGSVQIAREAVAVSDGAVSEQIEVENIGRGERYAAKIVGVNQLIVQ